MDPGWFDMFLKRLDGAVDAGLLARLADDHVLRDIADGSPPWDDGAAFRIEQAADLLEAARQSMIAQGADPTLLGELDELRSFAQDARAAALAAGFGPPDASPDIAEPSPGFGQEPDDPGNGTDLDIVGPWPP